MNKSAKYFAKHSHGETRLTLPPVARLAPRHYRASPASIGIAPARSYAKVFLTLTTRHCTGLNTLSRLSRIYLKKSGQREPNEYRLSRLSRLVPTIFNVYRNENEAARRVWGAGRELALRHKTEFMQHNRATQKVLPEGFACGYEAARFSARLCELKLGQLAFLSLQLS